MLKAELITLVRKEPESIEFDQVMTVILDHYIYTPTGFTNGDLTNEAGTNEGSCRLLYFAKLNELNEEETLSLFGHYYRDDVCGNPNGNDHGNIRNFILNGWSGIQFEGVALTEKK